LVEQLKELRAEFFTNRESMTDQEALDLVETKIYRIATKGVQVLGITGRSALAGLSFGSGGLLIAGGFIVAPVTYLYVGLLLTA